MRPTLLHFDIAASLLLSGCDGGGGNSSPASNADSLASGTAGGTSDTGVLEEAEGGAAVAIAAAMHMHAAADVPEPEPDAARSGGTWSSYFGETADTDHLTLAAGDAIVLDDCDVRFASLVIEGELSVDGSLTMCGDAMMRANTVLVTGTAAALRIGSEADPFTGRFTLSLTGDVAGPTRRGTEQRMLHASRLAPPRRSCRPGQHERMQAACFWCPVSGNPLHGQAHHGTR